MGVRVAPKEACGWTAESMRPPSAGRASFPGTTTLPRSLLADYTPYFVTLRVKLTWAASSKVTAQFRGGRERLGEHLGNNHGQLVIARWNWQATPALALAYASYAGNEQPDTLPRHTLRQSASRPARPGRGWDFWGMFDVGVIRCRDASSQSWYGAVVIGRKSLSGKVAVAAGSRGTRPRSGVR